MASETFQDRLSPQSSLTPAQRERLQIVTVAGTSEGPALWSAERHLMFAYELKAQGRIGEGESDDQ